jgi:hypothetical protein
MNDSTRSGVMQIGIPYLVTKSGDTGDVTEGMHVMFNTPELLMCMETQGYVDDQTVINEILEGAEVTPDLVGIKHMKEVHLEAIKNLSGFPEPSEEEWEAFKAGFKPFEFLSEERMALLEEAVAIVEAKDATIN